VQVWDIRMESEPVVVIPTHEHLRRKLCDLYENDCIFDKFECCTSGDGKYVMTGSYSNCFNIYDREGRHETSIEVRSMCHTPSPVPPPSFLLLLLGHASLTHASHFTCRCLAFGHVLPPPAPLVRRGAERTPLQQTCLPSTLAARCCTLRGTQRTIVWQSQA